MKAIKSYVHNRISLNLCRNGNNSATLEQWGARIKGKLLKMCD